LILLFSNFSSSISPEFGNKDTQLSWIKVESILRNLLTDKRDLRPLYSKYNPPPFEPFQMIR
jgi:hypothetical protein